MKQLLFIVALALSLFSTTAAYADDISLSPGLLHVFDLAHAKHGLKDARAALDAYILSHPKDGNGFAVRCFFRTGMAAQGTDMTPISADCRRATKLSPQSTFAHMELADFLFRTEHFRAAAKEYSATIDLGLTGQEIFWKRCDTYRVLKNFDAAAADCKRQLAIDPSAVHAQITLGLIRLEQRKYPESIARFQAALSLDPNSAQTHELLAQADLESGLYREVITNISSALTLGETDPQYYVMRGQAYAAMKDESHALADYNVALARYTSAKNVSMITFTKEHIAAIDAPAQSLPAISVSSAQNLFGTTFTPKEIATLLQGLEAGYSSSNSSVTIVYQLDPDHSSLDWNYGGAMMRPNGSPMITVILPAETTAPPRDIATNGAILLGLAESGYAGPKWKALYERMLQLDQALPKTASDPYTNRRSLANAMAELYKRFGPP